MKQTEHLPIRITVWRTELDPRPDHANYIAGWLEALKGDRTFVWSAASKASKAVQYLTGAADPVPETAAA